MNITDFVKNMNKTFKKYDVKFVANYADVYDSVAVFIKCKEPHVVADYLYDNHFKGVIGTNIGILHNEIVITFFDFSEYSSNETERLIIDAIFDANAKYKLFEGKRMNKKSFTEKELKMDVWKWGDVKGTDEELCNHIAEYAEEKGIEYMEITEDEFEYLKKDYLKKYKSMKESRFQKLDEFKKFCETDDRIVRCEWEELGEYTIYCEKGTDIEELADYMSDEFDGIYILNNNGSLVQYNRKYPHFEFLFRFHESKKSMKESVKSEIQLMVNNIIDELIGEYSSKEWDALSANEKFDIVRTEYFSFGYKSKYLSEVRDLVIENMNHPFNVVFESKKSMKESFDSIYATSDMVGKGGKEWLLEGSYNFIMEFLEDWGIAPTEVEYKNGKDYFYDHDGNEYGFYTDEDGALISITDKGTNYAWKNNLNRISTKNVKVYEESKKSTRKSLKEREIPYNITSLDFIQSDIESYFKKKKLNINIITSARNKAPSKIQYCYILEGNDSKNIKVDDLYDYLFSVNGILYHNEDFDVEIIYDDINEPYYVGDALFVSFPKTKEYMN